MPCVRDIVIGVRAPFALVVAVVTSLGAPRAMAAPVWPMYAGGPQHTATAFAATTPMQRIRWSTPVDLFPQHQSGFLLIHYGSPLCTEAGTMLIAVKTGTADGFRIEARRADDGTLIWTKDSDYTQPPHNWTLPFGACLTPSGRLYMPGAGGTLLYADGLDGPATPTFTRIAFYGDAAYNANQAGFDADIKISSPLTSDSQGNIYFTYRAMGSNPFALTHGLARVGADGSGTWRTTNALADSLGTTAVFNAAPALSLDESVVYTAVRIAAQTAVLQTHGWLVAADATTLAPQRRVTLMDPASGQFANVPQDGTTSPMVGPDGRIFFGVLERPGGSNAQRGYELQFNPDLTVAGPPAAFGWDDTPSLVPRSMIPDYTGPSAYLLMTKYNFYAGIAFGNGMNRIAVLDPNDSQVESHTGATIMKEIRTILGPTPDVAYLPNYPNAVREWCINTAVVDTFTQSILANCEDGILYRWDMATNSFTESIQLTQGIGEAYTPTMAGKDGAVYAINDAILFCVASNVSTAVGPLDEPGGLDFAAAHPTPFTESTSLTYRLPQAGRARIDVLDIGGRLVRTIEDRDLPAGGHLASWNGRTADCARAPAGVYLARLTLGTQRAVRRLVLTR